MDPAGRYARINRAGALHWGSDFRFEPKAGGGPYIVRAVFDRSFQEIDPDTGAPVMSTHPRISLQDSELPTGQPPVEGDSFQQLDRDGLAVGPRFLVKSPPAPEGHGTSVVYLRIAPA